jgi:hypothetical protein
MIEPDMEVHHHGEALPVAALSTMADSLPGLGIVAAVPEAPCPARTTLRMRTRTQRKKRLLPPSSPRLLRNTDLRKTFHLLSVIYKA